MSLSRSEGCRSFEISEIEHELREVVRGNEGDAYTPRSLVLIDHDCHLEFTAERWPRMLDHQKAPK